MVNGLYTASIGMSLLQQKVDTTTHNLANASTTGFKKSMLVGSSEVMAQRNDEWMLHQDEAQRLSEDYVSFEQGPMVRTEDPFDLAIEGDGFFEVRTQEGDRLTRNGALTRNGMGELVTLNGFQVLDRNSAPIMLEGDTVHFGEDGGVYLDNKRVAELSLVTVRDPKDLQREGSNLFRFKDGRPDATQPATEARLAQGMLEGSNVNTVDAMVQMIRFQRNYEMNKTAITSIDETLQKAVSEVGRVG